MKPVKLNKRIDELEAAMIKNLNGKKLDIDNEYTTDFFTDGMYVREMKIPAYNLVTSRIHKVEHPFVLSKGHVTVWVDGGPGVEIKAPYTGITKPGTRRVVYTHTNCVWTTFHPNPDNEKDMDLVEARNIEPYENELVKELIENNISKQIN